MKKNILVFPCGSEIALEIHRSLKHSTHFYLIGASSIDDHGKYIYEDYIGDLPFISDNSFIQVLKAIVNSRNIAAVYPAMDAVITLLKQQEDYLGCKVITSPVETTAVCLSKSKTYSFCKGHVLTPKIFESFDNITFPVFGKPDIGYGSRDVKKIDTQEELSVYTNNSANIIICEYLPGKEYTVDCFTDKNRNLLFCGARERIRIMNGISVNTKPYYERQNEIFEIVSKINNILTFRGAWFIQLKENNQNNFVLLEIAARFGGSSSLFRAQGINFSLLTLFDAFNSEVSIFTNSYAMELDRALDNVFKIQLNFNEVFCDFDDCLLIEKKIVNTELIAFLYQCLNNNIKLTLLTKHGEDLQQQLEKFRIQSLFDRIIRIRKDQNKEAFIDNLNSIFIDDSFSERIHVSKTKNIPVFSIDMVKMLIK